MHDEYVSNQILRNWSVHIKVISLKLLTNFTQSQVDQNHRSFIPNKRLR
jgi:hypothetical protein